MKRLTILFALLAIGVSCRRPPVEQPPVRIQTTITEDFSTDPSSRWTDDLTSVTWQSGTEDIDMDGTGTIYYNNTTIDGSEGYASVFQANMSTQYYAGILFRYDATSDDGYVVRHNGSGDWAWRYCNDASCSDIETTTGLNPGAGTYVYIHWSGTGSDTEVEIWVTGSDLGTDVGSWGTPDFTFTGNPGANARDSGNYVGLYEGGGGTGPTFDDFFAEDVGGGGGGGSTFPPQIIQLDRVTEIYYAQGKIQRENHYVYDPVMDRFVYDFLALR